MYRSKIKTPKVSQYPTYEVMLRSTLRALVLVLALYPRRVAVQVLLAHGRRRILLRTESSVDRRTLPRAQLIGLYVGFGCPLSTPDSPSQNNTAASQPASQDPARPSRSSKKRHLERPPDHLNLVMALALGLFVLLLVPGSSFPTLGTTRSTVRCWCGGVGKTGRLFWGCSV